MGISISTGYRRKLTLLGATLALCGLTSLVCAEEMTTTQAAGAPYAAPLAKLQVTGSAEKFSLDADHADAQSVLKLLFNQANAQFTTDSSVVGQVTMRLSGQSFSTTLDAVCKQLLIRYHKDTRGIYVFEQDTEATKAAITRLKDLNGLVRQQLRSYHLSLPEDSVLDNVPEPALQLSKKVAGGVLGASGLAGGGLGGSNGGWAPDSRQGVPNASYGAARGQMLTDPQRLRSSTKDDAGATNGIGRLNYLTERDLAQILQLTPQNDALQNPDDYRLFLQQNGLVFINTGGQKAVVRDVLQELGRQSNTSIVIDASVPTGRKFNLQGYITPRTLPEALNVLTQSTRLNWRWLTNSIIYVSALPDFQIFFNSTTPRVIFGANAYPTQQNGGQGQAPQNSVPAYGQPSQTPLPITNGEKKTP